MATLSPGGVVLLVSTANRVSALPAAPPVLCCRGMSTVALVSHLQVSAPQSMQFQIARVYLATRGTGEGSAAGMLGLEQEVV